MSAVSKYSVGLGNMTPHAPLQLDPILFGKAQTKVGNIPFTETGPMVSADLWSRGEDEASYIGVRVTGPIENQHALAADLAAVAVERQIVPVFLSRVGQCGMEKFGFRVELIGGSNEDEMLVCEEQLKRLWNLALVVDAAEILSFG